jgi:hypothetical protein
MRIRASRTKFWLLPILFCLLTLAEVFGAQPVSAVPCTGTSSDPDTCTARTAGDGKVCMANLFGPTVNCTANDVGIAEASNIRNPTTGAAITSCISGSPLNFTADFTVETQGGVTRFDIGLYFATDGDPNGDGVKSGECSVSKISQVNNTSNNFINLDLPANGGSQSTDTCGDIDNTHKPQLLTLTLSALCTESPLFFNPSTGKCQATSPGPNAQKCMLLPNGVSWRQTGANDICDSPIDAFPGTKAKCNVNPTFGIPVIVETAKVKVDKSANPTSVSESGGTVTYTVVVTNDSGFVDLTIDSIIDDIYGDLGDASNVNVTNNTCPSLIGDTLAPGADTSCTFNASVSGNPGSVTDIVEVCGHDNAGHTGLCGEDDATVTITNTPPAATIKKSADSVQCMTVRYKVVVENTSPVQENLTLNALCDSQYGDITVGGSTPACAAAQPDHIGEAVDCTLPRTIQFGSGNKYTCYFDGTFCGSSDTDRVTGTVVDGEGGTANPDSNYLKVTAPAAPTQKDCGNDPNCP